MAKAYKGEKIRVENGADQNLPIFGRFGCVIRFSEVRVEEYPENEPDERWGWYLFGNCWISGGCYASAEEAILQCEAFQSQQGYVSSRNKAIEQAIAEAKAAHNKKATSSPAYAKKYGGVIQ